MKTVWMVGLLALAGCGKKKDAPAPDPGSASSGSGSAVTGGVGSGSGSATAPSTCDVAGAYRIRFSSNGKDGWWFRFSVAGDKATLDESAEVLGVDKGPLDLKIDITACTLTLGMKSGAVQEGTMVLTLDPKTHAVSGTFDRNKAVSDGDKSTKVAGIHDGTTPPKGPACITRGVYKFTVGAKAKWKNSAEGDDRECTDPWMDEYFLVEPYGDTIAVSLRDSSAPFGERWGDDKVTKTGECSADVELQGEGFQLHAKLTFAADKITGTALHADQQIVEDGDEGENIWNCVTDNAPLEIARVDDKAAAKPDAKTDTKTDAKKPDAKGDAKKPDKK